jgi:hypothetical protein
MPAPRKYTAAQLAALKANKGRNVSVSSRDDSWAGRGARMWDYLVNDSDIGAPVRAVGSLMDSPTVGNLGIQNPDDAINAFQAGGLASAGGAFATRPTNALAAGGARPDRFAPSYGKQTVKDPVSMPYPGIYKDPRVIASEAGKQVAPESPALKELFGVTRDDLYEISKRKGNAEPKIKTKSGARGSATAAKIMNPDNEQRLLDALGEARGQEGLWKGMHGWYVMDPAYKRTEELAGPEAARGLYDRFNTFTGMSSPGSEVLTEINRGTAANMMNNLGRFDEYVKFGGMAEDKRGTNFPPELRDVIGHPYHSTAQALPMQNWIDKGEVDMGSPKVPLYIQSSGVPETGFQTSLAVPDAHFTRAVGLSDARNSKNPGASMKMPEYQDVGPWWRDKIAAAAELESVPAQAIAWGLFSPQTGVTSPIGAPKLELLAQRIMERAAKLGLDPKVVRDQVLLGQQHAVNPATAGIIPMLAAEMDKRATPRKPASKKRKPTVEDLVRIAGDRS